MKKRRADDYIYGKQGKGRTLPRVLFSILLLLLLTTCGLLGAAAFKQNSLLEKKDKMLSKANASLESASGSAISLNEEISRLKAALADCSSYLAEDDLDSQTDLPIPQTTTTSDSDKEDTRRSGADSKNSGSDKNNSASYQKKYKDLYVSQKDSKSGRVVHLTFDDGPSQNTPKVLDILDKYDIKATFFVVYTEEEPYCDYYKEIVERGHTLAIHTASHNYKQIYASVDAYLDDFNKIYTYVYEKTGVKPTLFRYPGGSTNCLSYSCGSDIMEEMKRRGFTYYDWNVSSGDGGNQATRNTIYEWVTSKASKLNESVVLMHDSGGKGETVAALPSVIETLQNAGCTFAPLTSATEPVQFHSPKKSD